MLKIKTNPRETLIQHSQGIETKPMCLSFKEFFTMMTPDFLLQVSKEAFAAQKYLASNGFSEVDVLKAKKKAMEAKVCAVWMKRTGVEELKSVGTFGEVNVKVGDVVRIRRNAQVITERPLAEEEMTPFGKLTAKSYEIRVIGVEQGSVKVTHGASARGEVKQATVSWMGMGGYVCSTSINNVELVEA